MTRRARHTGAALLALLAVVAVASSGSSSSHASGSRRPSDWAIDLLASLAIVVFVPGAVLLVLLLLLRPVAVAAPSWIVGVVTPAVDRVEIIATDGTHTPVPITVDRAFAYVVPQAELRRGVGPKEVVAYAADGTVIDRETTGVGR